MVSILRALEKGLDVTFKNEEKIHEFVIIIKREPGANDQENVQETHQVEHQESVQEKVRKPVLTKAQKDIVNFCSKICARDFRKIGTIQSFCQSQKAYSNSCGYRCLGNDHSRET